MLSRLGALTFLAIVAAPAAGHGQLQDAGPFVWRADLTGLTRYYWRGIRRNDHFALQPDAALGYARNGFTVTAGARASGDSELDDFFDDYFNELNAWGQVSIRRAGITASLGAMRFWYRAPSLPTVHTTEAYGWFRWQAGRWAPAVQIWTGLQGVHGGYIEPSLTRYHIANPFAGPGVSLSSTLRAGFQLGDRDPDSPLIPGPAVTGLTYVALSMTLRAALDLGPVTLVTAVGPEFRVNRDPAAKLQPNGKLAKTRIAVPFQVGFAFPGRRRQ